jgi:hypothetical protein
MDLKSKLSMLAGNEGFEEDLAGISGTPHENSQKASNEEIGSVIDFNLGTLSIDTYLKESGVGSRKSTKSTKKGSKTKTREFDSFFEDFGDDEEDIGKFRTGNRDLDETTARSRRLLEQADLLRADQFDSFLDDDRLGADEDVEMRNRLVSMGRKYARDSAASKESSEITKSFADSETKLRELYDEVTRDKANLERDIERMRVPGRGGKVMSDMITAKNSYHNTQLAIVKELNSIKKATFELRAKEQARKEAEAGGSSDINPNTLQSIFSSSRTGMVNGIGGYAAVSGSEDDSIEVGGLDYSDEDDEIIQKKYFSDQQSSSSDGDKWLKYEDRGVEYVLIVDGDGTPQTILAEDRDGNQIYDYPIPDISNITFDIDLIGKTATDNISRNYIVRVED